MSSKKNQACCRAPSLTLPLLTTHCRASSSWKSWEQEGTISKPFTIKHTAYRSLRLSFSEGDKMVLWHNVHCEAARVGRIHYSTDQTLNTNKQSNRTQGVSYHKWHIIPSSYSLQVAFKRRSCTQHPQEHDNHSNKTTTTTTTSSHSKTDRRRWGEGRLLLSRNWVSTFLVGKRPVNVCKKLALSVCDDMRLPLRSMAYGWGWMEGWQ